MVTIQITDGIATITLDRPHRLNALTPQAMDEIRGAVQRAEATPEVRVIVMTGAGRAFCSGYDLIEADTSNAELGDVIERQMIDNLNPLCEAILGCRVPTVAAVNGPCVGGGLGLALLADVCIATRSAYFQVPQVSSLGIVPDAGATWVLGRHVGRARALGMSLSGERISAERAERWGLIWQCVDDPELMTTATAVATAISSSPAASVATRRLVDSAGDAADVLAGEAEAQRILFQDPAVAANIDNFRGAVR